MNQYDPHVPHPLKTTQEWFGKIIGRPLSEEGGISLLAPSGQPIESESKSYIAPSPTLQPFERIQIYNQQYWWRLLNNLHDTFPFLTRLFGYYDFNETLAIPYLRKHPPTHWSLNKLGDLFPSWIQTNYLKEDRELTYAAAVLDEAHYALFFKPLVPSFTIPSDCEGILSQSLSLQPHVKLFHHPYDLFSLRREMLKEDPDYWISHDFPELKKEPTFTMLFRLRNCGTIIRKTLSSVEYLILKQFQSGTSIEAVCDWLEGQPEDIQEAAEKGLQLWFKEWTQDGVLMSNELTGSSR